MAADKLDVEYLFTLNATVDTEPHATIGGAPQGTRLIADVKGGSVEGPKVKGTIKTPGGDWLTMRANGTAQLDVRLLLVTDDGASILMQYKGIANLAKGHIRTAPLFETGDERYAWLNDIQAVAIGSLVPGGVSYEVYGLK